MKCGLLEKVAKQVHALDSSTLIAAVNLAATFWSLIPFLLNFALVMSVSDILKKNSMKFIELLLGGLEKLHLTSTCM